jgi:ABC-2 type transport system permease protein
MFLHLAATQWRILVNSHRSHPRAWLRLATVTVLGSGFAAGVWWSSNWFFTQCLAFDPIGEVVVRRALGMTLLTVFSLLGFSSLIGAFSSLYLADDLQLLVSRPIPAYALYGARFVETGVTAAWMIVPFSLPIFLAAGKVLGAGGAYYLKLTAVYVALAVLPTSAGVVVSLLLTSVLSARRARHMFVFAGSLVLGVMLFILRRLRPEQLMNPDEGAPLIEALQAMQGLDPPWLPSSWALDALWPHLGYAAQTQVHPVALLITASAASFFLGGWIFRGLYGRAFSRAQEGLRRGSEDARGTRHPIKMARYQGAAASRPTNLRSSLTTKDRLVFVRDTAQWSQMLILGAIVAIYLLNFKYIQVVTGTGLVSDIGLHFLNLALCGFVSVALAARFVYPVVSLEGPAFWLVRSSPNTMLSFLDAKAATWALWLPVFANLLVVTTHVFLDTDPLLSVLSLLTISPLVVGVVWLGVGLGARHPRFKADSAAAIATGLGGVLFMLTGTAVLLVTVLGSTVPTVAVLRFIRRGHDLSPGFIALSIGCAVVAVTVPLIAGRIAMRIGARHLEKGV